tara:strand:+ start:181 stop:792 length:612 start_codon:yes stop_codon:yes gene_type:complete
LRLQDPELNDQNSTDQSMYIDPSILGINNQMGYSAGRKKDEVLGKWEIHYKTEILDFIMGLKGFYLDEKEKIYIKNPHATVIMNERGINDYHSILKSKLSKIIPLTKLTEGEINERMRHFCETVADLIFQNFEAYEIPSLAYAEILKEFAESLALAIYKMAEGGWTAKNRISMININQNQLQQEREQNTKKTMLAGFWGGGGQ